MTSDTLPQSKISVTKGYRVVRDTIEAVTKETDNSEVTTRKRTTMADPSGRTGAPNGANGSSEESSSLDHALLESLFYNEMMMMDDSSLSSHLLSSLTSDGAPEASTSSALPDPSTLVEKDLLRRFGVSGSPMTKPQHAEWASTSAPGVHHETLPPVPDLPEPPEIHTNAPPAIASSHPPAAVPVAPRPPVTPTRGQGIIHSVASVPPAAAPISEEEKRKKLVSQFATLASRLGIALPPQIVQSLTAAEKATFLPGGHSAPPFVPSATSLAANQRNGQVPPHQPPFAPTAPSSNFQPQPPIPPIKPTPAVQQLQSTAEAAVAAVTENRKRANEEGSNSDGGAAKPAYSKRRKKPRLVDCENKLAQLKAENEMLKRHLANVSSQSHKFDQERAEAEQRMRTMLENNAGPEQLDEVVKNFTELYSDYGRRRHQELTFHLEQLQR